MAEVSRIEKTPRPAHVILLSDLIQKLSKHPRIDALLVAWSLPDPDDETASRVGSSCIGTDATCHFLASRFAARLLTGQLPRGPLPSDT